MSLRRALASLLLIVVSPVSPLTATPAHAYRHDATAAVLERVVEELPLSARATLPSPVLAHELDELLADADLDPERCESGRRGRWGEGGLEGGLIEAYACAERDLRIAWALGDRHKAADAIVRLAQAACDLADPYRTVTGEQDECEGARAHFTDEFDPATLDGVHVRNVRESRAGALNLLAHESAAVRAEVEDAHLRGDEGALTRLRNERLSAAATHLAASVAAAWHPAPRADLRLSLGPNPLRGALQVAFTLEQAAEVRLDLYDLAGRRQRTAALGRRAAGPQQVVLPAGWTEGLPAGVYLARIDADGQHAVQRLTRLAD